MSIAVVFGSYRLLSTAEKGSALFVAKKSNASKQHFFEYLKVYFCVWSTLAQIKDDLNLESLITTSEHFL